MWKNIPSPSLGTSAFCSKLNVKNKNQHAAKKTITDIKITYGIDLNGHL